MECKLLAALFILSILVENRRSFVEPAPLNKDKDKSTDDIVRELENLKRLLGEASKNGEEISVSKSQTSFFLNNNGHKSGYNNIKNEVEKNGKLIAKVQQKTDIVNGSKGPAKSVTKTEVEIPSKGIHNIIVENGPNMKLKSESAPGETHGGVEKINNLLGMEYSPLDMAEYIYWTGDEKNVALMIEELLEEGLMSRQEAINFLQSIKYNLDFMQARDKGLKNVDKKASETIKKNSYQNPSNLVNHEKSEQEFSKMRNSIGFESKFLKNFLKGTSSGDENENIVLERLKMADLLDKEYFLEEVIYQLARVMFSQSMTKGSREAEAALHKLVAFLQKEVKNGQISRNLEKKLLVVLFSALTDTLAEQTESTVDNKKESFSNSNDLFSNNLETSEVESSLGDASMRTDSIGKSLSRETKPNVADSLKNSE